MADGPEPPTAPAIASFTGIQIKQEKITPPSSPKPLLGEQQIDNVADPTNDYIDPVGEDKKSVQPAKSSNEILAELFQVFGTIPTDDFLADLGKMSKKKHKKEKKHKRQKHRDDESGGGEVAGSSAEPKLKKVKKEKKEKGKDKEKTKAKSKETDKLHRRIAKDKEAVITQTSPPQSLLSESEIKKEKRKGDHNHHHRHHHKRSRRELDLNDEVASVAAASKEDLDIVAYEKQLSAQTSTSDKVQPNKTKIIIKDLKNSSVLEDAAAAVAKQKERRDYRKRRTSDHNRDEGELSDNSIESRHSEISLSDEETYNMERNRYYEREQRDDSQHGRDNYRGGDRSDRNRGRNDDRYNGAERAPWRSRRRFNDDYHRRRRSESRDRRRDNSEDRIDKKRLLEIARKNAISMLRNGTLPGTQNMAPEAKEKVLAKMRFGGKSVDELTEFCKKLSNGEAASGYLSNVSDDSDHDRNGNDRPFNHPFVLKDPGPIVMNIRNSVPIPPKSAEQTKAILMQFPVSSGQHHRLNESEWVPVVPPKKQTAATKAQPMLSTSFIPPAAKSQNPAVLPTGQPSPLLPALLAAAAAETAPPIVLSAVPPPPQPVSNIFPDTKEGANLDVTSIITMRLNAMRKLQDNPHDSEALKLMYNTQKDMSSWANSKFVPGQFTGSTGANVLSARELTSGFQAWAKRDQLMSTVPVSGGMGMHLLQKMGWRPGEGLGKEKNGSLQPLLLEVKLDKKGLLAHEENPNIIRQMQQQQLQLQRNNRSRPPSNLAAAKQSLENKHPVSLLGELAAKRRWQLPIYTSLAEQGPQHHMQFMFTVAINGQVYKPPQSSNTKKEAKSVAAKFALQQMGVL